MFGAQNVGIHGILVKTGKYIENIENQYQNKPQKISNTFADAVEWLMDMNFEI